MPPPFEPDHVYAGVPYRVVDDGAIDAIMQGHQRPRLELGLIMALAIGTVAGVFGYYGILVCFFFD